MLWYPGHPEQKAILTQFCNEELVRQSQYLATKYKLKNYNPTLRINYRANARTNWGGHDKAGRPFIVLAPHCVWPHVGTDDLYTFDEYEHIIDDPEIGFGYANWKQHTAWTMAHEMAHTIVEHHRFRPKAQRQFSKEIANDVSGHGLLWQAVYRDLRAGFCTADKYVCELIDFTNSAYYIKRKIGDETRIVFLKLQVPFAWVVKRDGALYSCNKDWVERVRIPQKTVAEVLKTL